MYKNIIYKYVSVCISWQVYMYIYIFASNRNTNDDHEYHYNPKKTGKNSIPFHILTATLGKNGQSKVQKPTLWWTNIATEHGHRNSGFSH